MAPFHGRELRMGRRDESVFPDLPVLHDQLQVIAVAKYLQFFERVAIDHEQVGMGLWIDLGIQKGLPVDDIELDMADIKVSP